MTQYSLEALAVVVAGWVNRGTEQDVEASAHGREIIVTIDDDARRVAKFNLTVSR